MTGLRAVSPPGPNWVSVGSMAPFDPTDGLTLASGKRAMRAPSWTARLAVAGVIRREAVELHREACVLPVEQQPFLELIVAGARLREALSLDERDQALIARGFAPHDCHQQQEERRVEQPRAPLSPVL